MGEGHDEEVADDTFGFEGVGEGLLEVDLVVVAAAFADAGEGTDLLEVGDDFLDGALGYADVSGAVAKAHIGIFMEQHEDMGMVGKKRPCRERGRVVGIHLLHAQPVEHDSVIRQPQITKRNSLIEGEVMMGYGTSGVVAKFGWGEETGVEGGFGRAGEGDGDGGELAGDGEEEGGGIFLDGEVGGVEVEVKLNGRERIADGEVGEVVEIVSEEEVKGGMFGEVIIEEAEEACERQVEDSIGIDNGV